MAVASPVFAICPGTSPVAGPPGAIPCSVAPPCICGDPIPDLLRPLGSSDQHVRQAACQSLAKAECHSDPRVVSALITRLHGDCDAYVRQAAASALGQSGLRREGPALDSVLERAASDPDAGVRRLASSAVGQLAPRGLATAVVALLARLEDRDGGVRRSALKALEKVAERGDTQVVQALLVRSADSEAFVRHRAVEVSGRLADEGNPDAIARFLDLLELDRDARVRCAATEAVGKLARRGDSHVLSALLTRLDDEADSVRRTAAAALGRVTFAPLQDLEQQERHIAELESCSRHEVNTLHMAIQRQKETHDHEVVALRERIAELEELLQTEVEERDRVIRRFEAEVLEQGRLARVGEFLPHASKVTRFLETLPSLGVPGSEGTEIVVPVWALRCVCAAPASGAAHARGGAPNSSFFGEEAIMPMVGGKDRRELLALFELFEQLSVGRVTAMELTESKPLDVYVHQGEDEKWGLYCCSRHRLLALLMLQACARAELITARCVIRSKEDSGYWAWHWANFFDGEDGLNILASPVRRGPTCSNLTAADQATPMTPPCGSSTTRSGSTSGRATRRSQLAPAVGGRGQPAMATGSGPGGGSSCSGAGSPIFEFNERVPLITPCFGCGEGVGGAVATKTHQKTVPGAFRAPPSVGIAMRGGCGGVSAWAIGRARSQPPVGRVQPPSGSQVSVLCSPRKSGAKAAIAAATAAAAAATASAIAAAEDSEFVVEGDWKKQ